MQPRMKPDEISLLTAFLQDANKYLEFGSGGSTFLASTIVKGSIVSLDSSQEWLDKVAQACAAQDGATAPHLVFVDIGPIGAWGAPTDPDTRSRWPAYHTDIWATPGSEDADLYMVDGRFRIACFMQTLLHCRRDAVILIHDFAMRPGYHIVREVARQIASASELAAFVPRADMNTDRVRAILQKYEYQYG